MRKINYMDEYKYVAEKTDNPEELKKEILNLKIYHAETLDAHDARVIKLLSDSIVLTKERNDLRNKLRIAEAKLRDRQHPSTTERDPPEVLRSLGFWPECGCGECYAIHCLGEALDSLQELRESDSGDEATAYWKGHDEAVAEVWEKALTHPIPKPGKMNEPLEGLYRRTEALRKKLPYITKMPYHKV